MSDEEELVSIDKKLNLMIYHLYLRANTNTSFYFFSQGPKVCDVPL